MLFNSLEFALFLPLVFLLYWFVFQRSLRLQNLFIVVASYVFYGWWDWKFLLLIALTSFCSWLSGIWMGDTEADTPASVVRRRRLIMVTNIVLNLVILAYFKYYNFFVSSFIDAFSFTGLNLHTSTLKIILPVGISFYTFQALSYSIDVYRGNISPTQDLVAFFAFVSFFPQLVAGPIERATNLLPQFQIPRTFNYPQAVDGCRQMLWGFFKKMVVADNCAMVANAIFDGYESRPAGSLIVGAIFFAFQIYGDFSGYSDIAIGCSRLFGINLMRNFAYPYFSRDIAEFWRRWHISLSTWFRDYVYIPLGGSRVGQMKKIRNTFVIFLVSGFWHGANWTFIAWGALHALLFMPLMFTNKNRQHLNEVSEGKIIPPIKEVYQILLTFFLITIAWILFRAPSISAGFDILHNIMTLHGGIIPNRSDISLRILPWVVLLFSVEWFNRTFAHGLARMPAYKPLRYSVYWGIMLTLFFFRGSQQSFIYFQF